MQARIIGKNNDRIAFETNTGDYGYLEIIRYDNGDVDIDDILTGDFSQCVQTVVRHGSGRFTVMIEDLGLSPELAMERIGR
jgi:hypothetical protein